MEAELDGLRYNGGYVKLIRAKANQTATYMYVYQNLARIGAHVAGTPSIQVFRRGGA